MLTAFFAMFSTSYTVIDGFSRSFAECCAVLRPAWAGQPIRNRNYFGFVIASSLLACAILVYVGNPVTMVTAAALVSLTVAPFLYAFNLYCVTRHIVEKTLRPSVVCVALGFIGTLLMLAALVTFAYAKLVVG